MIIEAAFAVRTVQSTLSFANSFSHKSHFYFLVNYTVTEVESLIYTAFFNQEKSSPKKCVNCSQLKMILSCRLLGHLFDDLFMIVVVGKHIEHTAACAPFIMLIDQD